MFSAFVMYKFIFISYLVHTNTDINHEVCRYVHAFPVQALLQVRVALHDHDFESTTDTGPIGSASRA